MTIMLRAQLLFLLALLYGAVGIGGSAASRLGLSGLDATLFSAARLFIVLGLVVISNQARRGREVVSRKFCPLKTDRWMCFFPRRQPAENATAAPLHLGTLALMGLLFYSPE